MASYNGRAQPKGITANEPSVFTAKDAANWLVRLYYEWGKPETAAKWWEKLDAAKGVASEKPSTSERSIPR